MNHEIVNFPDMVGYMHHDSFQKNIWYFAKKTTTVFPPSSSTGVSHHSNSHSKIAAGFGLTISSTRFRTVSVPQESHGWEVRRKNLHQEEIIGSSGFSTARRTWVGKIRLQKFSG